MVFGWLAPEWERKCSDCGFTWRVPRAIALRGVRGMAAVTVMGASAGPRRSNTAMGALQSGISDRAELMESFRRCPRCGVDRFTQRPLPRRER
jgi:hypothetical protein